MDFGALKLWLEVANFPKSESMWEPNTYVLCRAEGCPPPIHMGTKIRFNQIPELYALYSAIGRMVMAQIQLLVPTSI